MNAPRPSAAPLPTPPRRAALSLARRLAWRDWRSGEVRLLLAALLVAVASVTAISLFVDRLQRALLDESADFLAADRYISASRALPEAYREQAQALGLSYADTLLFPSMVFGADDRNTLASVKAVTPGYPLRGELQRSAGPFEQGAPTDALPAPGEVWLESRLFPALGIALGDRIDVGLAQLTVAGVLTREPDRGGSMFDMGPRVLMRFEDVPATEVVQPGSRLRYRLLLRGAEADLERFKASLELPEGQRWVGIRDSSPSIGGALNRAESFLLLGGLLAVLLAGIAVALAAHRYARRHFDHVAVLKTLGSPPSQILASYTTVLLLVAAAAVPVGLLAGYLLHGLIVLVLQALLPVALPASGWSPYVLGAVTGLICAVAFALPAFLHLRGVSPMSVIRRDLGASPPSRYLSMGFAGAGILALLIWYTGSLALTLWTLGISAAVLLVFGGLAFALLRGSRALGTQAGSQWRFALASLQRRRLENTSQILIFGLALMLLLMLVLLRTALLEEWQQQIPEDAPNHFVINIAPDEMTDFRGRLEGEQLPHELGYAVVRGRVTALNDESAAEVSERLERERPSDGRPRLGSERNLTWAEALPEDNDVVAGRWWAADSTVPEVSLEEDYARELGIEVGDELTFDIAGAQLRAPVTSIRRLSWESMRPNFFIIFSPGALDDYPATFMTSFYLPRERKAFLNELLRAHPTVTVIEVDAIMAQVQSIVARVSRAVELILYLVIAAGALVLIASIQASRDARMAEHALLRALGATRGLVAGSLAIEFAALGLLAGLVAAIGAELAVAVLNDQVFGLPATLHGWLWVGGPLLGALLIMGIGVVSTRELVRTPPMLVLRSLR
ncbi:MAG: FtsX-like permease family protein [Pseudomonadota bacterium]